jgi:hypothetical protein
MRSTFPSNTSSSASFEVHLTTATKGKFMDVFEVSSDDTHLHEPSVAPMPVKVELLPPVKQLLVESRQLQTIADLLLEQSKRQITTAKRRMTLLNLLRRRLREYSHTYIHDDSPPLF